MAAVPDPDALIPVPYSPPREWFTEIPDWFDPTGSLIQVDWDTGRVAALVAPYGDCLLDGSAQCWSPPVSNTGYEYAHVGTVIADDGEPVRVANVGGGVAHASPYATPSVAQDHYANTASRKMVGRYVDSPEAGGIVFVGSMYPGSTNRDALECLSCALSGDWRWVQALNDYEMVGSQLVSNPGFRPVPGRVRMAALRFVSQGAKVAAAVCGGVERIVGEWTPVHVDDDDSSSFADAGLHLAALADKVVDLIDASGVDVELPARTAAFGRRGPKIPVDKDRDGRVFDGTKREMPAPPRPKRLTRVAIGANDPSSRDQKWVGSKLPLRDRQLKDRRVLKGAESAHGSTVKGRKVKARLTGEQRDRITSVNRRNLNRERFERGSGDRYETFVSGQALDRDRDEVDRRVAARRRERARRARTASVVRRLKPGQTVDGDGDGRVFDGTKKERPATPAESKAGDLLRAAKKAGKGKGDGGGKDRKVASRKPSVKRTKPESKPGGIEMTPTEHGGKKGFRVKSQNAVVFFDNETAAKRYKTNLESDPDYYSVDEVEMPDGGHRFRPRHTIDFTDGAAEPQKLEGPPQLPDDIAKMGGIDSGKGTPEDPFLVSNMDTAVALLADGRFDVQLHRPDEVATLVDKLAAYVNGIPSGKSKPTLNLCKVSVKGTNLFCAESLGRPRTKMPQLKTKDPVEGSMAATLPADRGEVNLEPAFYEYLRGRGIGVSDATWKASHLKASQAELNGGKVSGMVGAMRDGTMSEGKILVTSDGYVVDGHHRWAANVARAAGEGVDADMPVVQLDIDIVSALALANEFAIRSGSLPKQASLRARIEARRAALASCRSC